MYKLLFTNWKIAALWVIGTMASLGAVFAGGEESRMNQALDQIKAQAPPAPVVTDAPIIVDDVPGQPDLSPDSDSSNEAVATTDEDGVTHVTLPDGRRAVLHEVQIETDAGPAEGEEAAP